MPLTLKDIARMAGVAESTVSRAINNKPGVGEKTREKIMKLVRENNYHPNQLAQGLAKKETRIISLILSDITTPGYMRIIKSVEKKANQMGYQVILCNTDNNLAKEKAYLELVSQNRVDGAIIIGGELADKNILNLALNNNGQLVLVNCLAEEMLIPTVLIDNSQGGYLATNHLLESYPGKVAIVMGPGENYLESEKLAGYKQALSEHNLPFGNEYILETDGSRKGGFQAFLEIMKLEELPEAFFVTSDLLAVGLVEAIKMGGYFIPEDFALVSYGETLVNSVISPSLTVIAEPLANLGEIAAANLIKLLSEQNPDEMIRVLEPELIVRDSSLPPNIK